MAIDAAAAADYLGKLLNRPVTADTTLRLSSAQRARFNGWLHNQGMVADAARLAGEFTLTALLSGAGSAVAAAGAAPPSAVSSSTAGALGIDIQSISELMAGKRGNDFKADAELLRLFTLQELSYAQARPHPGETLAGLFAAKEAIRKCIGGPTLSTEAFRALEVLPDDSGRPVAAGYDISISHSGDFAVAVACRTRAQAEVPALPAVAAWPVSAAAATAAAPTARWLPLALLATTLVLISLHLLFLSRLGG